MLHEELPLEKCYFEFFCRHDLTLPHAKFHIYEIPLHVFLQIFDKIYETNYSLWNLDNFASSWANNIFSHFNLECWIFSSLFCREVSRQRNFTQKLKDQTAQKVCLHWQRSAVDCRMGRLDRQQWWRINGQPAVSCLSLLPTTIDDIVTFTFQNFVSFSNPQTTSLDKTFPGCKNHRWYFRCHFHFLQLSAILLPSLYTASTFYLQQSTTVLFRKHIILAHQPYTIGIIILL